MNSDQRSSVAGQVAIVTGGGRGVGRAIALRLAGAGMAVTVAARSADEIQETVSLIERAGGRAFAHTVDVSDWTAVQAMVAETVRRCGPVDLLISNAGMERAGARFWEMAPADWWRVVEVNLGGVVLCARAVLPAMVERGRGRIINVGSNSAIRTNPLATAYASSKAAVLRFTDSLAAEAAPFGVQVFAISPGLVRTAMTEAWQRAEQPAAEPTSAAESNLMQQSDASTGTPSAASALRVAPDHGGPEAAQRAEGRVSESATVRARPPGAWLPPERAADLCLALAEGRADSLTGRFIHAADDLAALVQAADRIHADDLYILRLPKLDGLAR